METKGERVDALGLVWLTPSHSVAWADEATGGVVVAADLCVTTESGN